MSTQVQLINHSSLLLKDKGKYILTDPWHLKPAFSSWMPTFQQYIHPSYLSALGENLSIVISHGHDDHCDDDLLKIFDRNTEFVFTKFKSSSVFNRLKRLGFQNFQQIEPNSNNLIKIHGKRFRLKSYINTTLSEDDSIITIATDSGVVIHANDNWIRLSDSNLKSIKDEIKNTKTKKGYLFTQTNSASGFPLNYPQLEEKSDDLLRKKVIRMIESGMSNAITLGLDKIFSYAGYATPYVDSENYNEKSFLPTPRFIVNELFGQSNSYINIANFYPGDTLNISNGTIDKAFISSENYSDNQIKISTENYYKQYKHMPIDYYKFNKSKSLTQEEVNWFMVKLNDFASKKVSQNNELNSINGKTFSLKIEDVGVVSTIQFGKNEKLHNDINLPPNKECIIQNSSIFLSILKGDLLFESLYTGYLGKWKRYPADIYNQDVITIIVMFSYFYRNVLVKDYIKKFV